MPEPPIIRVDGATRLRPWTVDDVPALYETVRRSQAHIAEWMSWAERYTIDSADEFVAKCLAEYGAGQMDWAVEVGGDIAGAIGVPRSTPEHREYEVGYWLALPYTKRGIMTRCVAALADYLFRERDAHRVQIAALTGNAPSRAIAERLGFTLEGVFRLARWHRRQWHDMAWYAITEDEWREARRRETDEARAREGSTGAPTDGAASA